MSCSSPKSKLQDLGPRIKERCNSLKHLFHDLYDAIYALALTTVTALCTATVVAVVLTAYAKADSALESYLGEQGELTLSKEDLQVLNALYGSNKASTQKRLASRPIVSKPGEVKFIFGASDPTLVTSLLNVSDIALEPNENIVDVKVGDSARWIIDRSISGSPEGPIEHITVKPTDVGLKSNLKIYTDRRTYTINLKSSATEYIPVMSFIYPEKSLSEALNLKQNATMYLQDNSLLTPMAGLNGRNRANADGTTGMNTMLIEKLDFAYDLSGTKSLMPVRVYTDGHKTFVQMSEKALQGSLPGLVVVNETSLFGSDKIAVTNYRLIDNIFVVDGIPKHLRVIKGEQGKAHSADIEMSKDNQYF